MAWQVLLHSEFATEAEGFPEAAQVELAAKIRLLQHFGPQLKRPHCDTLNGSRHANMKELRFNAGSAAWRIAFAFDRRRRAIILVGGDKSGMSQAKFYRDLIRTADQRFDGWLET